MKIIGDYHTHTIYSHGKGTIRDNVEAAVKKGLKTICIADHGPGHMFFGVNIKKLRKMREEIEALKKEFPEIEILLGVEANLVSMDGDIDVKEEHLKLIDKLLLGFHNGAKPKSLIDGYKLYLRNYLARFLPFLRERCRRDNTLAMIRAIKRYEVDIITHPGAKIDIDTKELARAAKEKGVLLEINASHGNLTVEYARVAKDEGANFIINSDAHVPDRVGETAMGLKIAESANIPLERIYNIEK